MKPLFADTFFYIALFSKEDSAHLRVWDFAESCTSPIITTEWILVEVADAFADSRDRRTVSESIMAILQDPNVHVVPASSRLLRLGLELYRDRPDKAWSLSDCISFVVMRKRRITSALTADRHFIQAGFKALLK